MTNLSSITVDLEHAKKLRESGWPQTDGKIRPISEPPFLYWSKRDDGEWELIAGCHGSTPEDIDAPTAEEILRKLPQPLAIVVTRSEAAVFCGEHGQEIDWSSGNADCVDYIDNTFLYSMKADTLVNASAALWCYLRENNLLPPSNHDPQA